MNRLKLCTRTAFALAALQLVSIAAGPRGALALDLCGCADSPDSLGDFHSSIEATYPPGTTRISTTITLQLPADGRLIFDNFALDGIPGSPASGVTIHFMPNAANDPVRLLVKGDVTIPANGSTIDVSGSQGTGTSADPRGGLGGPGGFRGGDGTQEQTLGLRTGGYGLGPGGGAPGMADAANASGHDATFVGNNELIPLIGGGGGGGGSTGAADCSSGGGGGGGGAILIAANGTLLMDGFIFSYGGTGRTPYNCAAPATGYGGNGSSGAIRLVADTIAGSGNVYANSPTPGRIRLEGFDISPTLNTVPAATRSFAPVAEGQYPRLAITDINGETESRINGEPLSERPQGVFGAIDVIASGGMPLTATLSSRGLASGTKVQVSAKRRNGGGRLLAEGTLGNCMPDGSCVATATFTDLVAGRYVVEAAASFQ